MLIYSFIYLFISNKRANTEVAQSIRGPHGTEPRAPWLTLSLLQDEPYSWMLSAALMLKRCLKSSSSLTIPIILDCEQKTIHPPVGPSWSLFGILSSCFRILKPYPCLPLQEVIREGHYGWVGGRVGWGWKARAGEATGNQSHELPTIISDWNILPWNREASYVRPLGDWNKCWVVVV